MCSGLYMIRLLFLIIFCSALSIINADGDLPREDLNNNNNDSEAQTIGTTYTDDDDENDDLIKSSSSLLSSSSTSRMVLSPDVLESYLSNLQLDPGSRMLALEHINEQFGHIYNLDSGGSDSSTPSSISSSVSVNGRRVRPYHHHHHGKKIPPGRRKFLSRISNNRVRMPFRFRNCN